MTTPAADGGPPASGPAGHTRTRHAVAGNFAVSGTGYVGGVALGMVTIGIMTRALGKADYGLYLPAFVFLNTIVRLTNFGIPVALLQMMARGASEERVFGGVFGLRVAIGLVSFALAPLLVVLLFDYDPAVDHLVLVGCAGFFFFYISGVVVSVFQRHLVMVRSAIGVLCHRGLFLALVAIGSVLHLGSWAVYWMMGALAAAHTVTFVVYLVLARPFVPLRPRYEATIWREAYGTSWPLAVTGLTSLLCMQADVLLLAQYRTSAEVGLYGLPYQIGLTVLGVIPGVLMSLLLPPLASSWKNEEREACRDYMQMAFDFFVVALVPILVVILSDADRLVVLLGGAEFAGAASIFRIHALGIAAMFFSVLFGHTAIAMNRQRQLIVPTLLVTSATLVAYRILIPGLGVHAAAWVKASYSVGAALANFGVVFAAMRWWPRWGLAARTVVLAAVMLAVMAGVRSVVPAPLAGIADIAAGLVVYAVGLFALRIATPAMLRDTVRSMRRERSPA